MTIVLLSEAAAGELLDDVVVALLELQLWTEPSDCWVMTEDVEAFLQGGGAE